MADVTNRKQPLSDPQEAEIHIEFIGTWIWKNSSVKDDEWVIVAAGEGFPKGMLRITVVEDDKTETLFAFSSKIDDDYYLNAVHFKNNVVPAKWDMQQVDAYTLLAYKVSKDSFTATFLNDGFLRKAISAGKISGKIGQGADEETHLTASTAELQTFFVAEKVGNTGLQY